MRLSVTKYLELGLSHRIHLFSMHSTKYLSNAYSMPGTIMDSKRDAVVIKKKNPFSSEGQMDYR